MADLIIFTKPGCPYCAAAIEDLQQRSIRYLEYNARDDAEALRRMLEQNGNRRHVPTLVDGDRVTVGFGGY